MEGGTHRGRERAEVIRPEVLVAVGRGDHDGDKTKRST